MYHVIKMLTPKEDIANDETGHLAIIPQMSKLYTAFCLSSYPYDNEVQKIFDVSRLSFLHSSHSMLIVRCKYLLTIKFSITLQYHLKYPVYTTT